MEIVLMVVPGCPHEKASLDLIGASLQASGLSASVEVVVVATDHEARDSGFIGSPTFLVDGRDAFPTPAASPGLACRVYPSPHGLAGVPLLDDLRDALLRAARP